MNKKQTVVMWVGIAIVVLMGLYPPWTGFEDTHYLGYKFIWSPPNDRWLSRQRTRNAFRYTDQIGIVDFPRLSIQWIMVSAIIGGLIITLRDKKDKQGGR